MASVTILEGDNRDSLAQLIEQGIQVDSVVTDAPYGLTSIQKRFGKQGSAPARHNGNDGSFGRLSAGFMEQTWDGTKIERDPEFWRLVWQVMKPGAFVFAFSGSRTQHWQGVAMELAGFVIHPLHVWLNGQGFPKGQNAAREVEKLGVDPTQWEGWFYGTQAQKPAMEPIFLAQKPFFTKTGGANIARYGVGAVNIDGCRVPLSEGELIVAPQSDPRKRGKTAGEYALAGRDLDRMHAAQRASADKTNALGRHPSNVLLDNSAIVRELFPNDTHRFFHQFALDADDGPYVNGGIPDMPLGFWNVKATAADRAGSKHPTVKPITLMQYLVRHLTPPGGIVLDPFAGSGTTGEAAIREGHDCILMEAHPPYVTFLRERFRDSNMCDVHAKGESITCESLLDLLNGTDTQNGFPDIDLLGEDENEPAAFSTQSMETLVADLLS